MVYAEKEVVLYVRTSTMEQTTENQIIALKDYCARMNFTITDIYNDSGWSGKDDKRPEFERLLADMRQNKIRSIIVFKLDRIGRSLQNLIQLFQEFKNRNIEFISMTQNITSSTPEGVMFWQLLGIFAQYERSLIISRTMSGLNRARRQGKILGRPKGSKDSGQRKKSGYYLRWSKTATK